MEEFLPASSLPVPDDEEAIVLESTLSPSSAPKRGGGIQFIVNDDDMPPPATSHTLTSLVNKEPSKSNTTNNFDRHKSLRQSLKDGGRSTKVNKMSNLLASTRARLATVLLIPLCASLWYSAAILFPPQLHERFRLVFWDDGNLAINEENGQPEICPRASICSEGILQIILIACARLSAFASYVYMGVTFVSKMHSLIHFLSKSYLRTIIPFESLHHEHTHHGYIFAILACFHGFTHYLRYILRGDTEQLATRYHFTGLMGLLAMAVTVLPMSGVVKRFFKKVKFETRFHSHCVGIIVLAFFLCLHHRRTRVIMLIFFLLWVLDYAYGLIFKTHNLEVVEFLPLPNQAGVQMLWRNPPGVVPRSGEYFKVQIPWLQHGGNQWHPFSIYLTESTSRGWRNVHGRQSNRHLMLNQEMGPDLCLETFINEVLEATFMSAESPHMTGEAREDLRLRSETTQVFICPVGDWTKGLMEELHAQNQKRACWVRGPYTSPYSIVQSFSHLVLTATGIGITPALGVMGQYPGFSRTKILVWSTRDKTMLKFFAPFLKDCHLAVVYYTGKDALDDDELTIMRSYGNLFIQQSRPKSLPGAIETVVVEFENHMHSSVAESIHEIDSIKRASWCVLYCGGSFKIRDDLGGFAKKHNMGFQSELFDW